MPGAEQQQVRFPNRVADGGPKGSRGSLIGDGFQLPYLMLFIFIMLQLVPPSVAMQCVYEPEEGALRSRVQHTVWRPGTLQDHPGDKRLVGLPMHGLQASWIDAYIRGFTLVEPGPQWAAERIRAVASAGVEEKRAGPGSARGGWQVISPGLGRESKRAW